MQAIISGVFPWSHHWIFPVMAGFLLVQSFFFRARGPGGALAGLAVLLLGISVARLPTIFASHHLIHFAIGFALVAVLHWRLSGWAASPPWRTAHRWWAGGYALVALAAAVIAWRLGIWWGIVDGT